MKYIKLYEEFLNEGRTIEKIEKDRTQVINDMAKIVTQWTAAKQSGNKEAEAALLQSLKDLTAEKKELGIELNHAIAGKDRDIELVISEAEEVKKDIHDHWQEVYGKDFIAEHPAVAKILKNRKNLDLREFERIWDESYEEDFKETHPNIWDKMNKS